MQCAFLAHLYITGSVAAAARTVGKSRTSAYKLRVRSDAESFAAAWDGVLAGPSELGTRLAGRRHTIDWRKLTHADMIWRIEIGFLQPVIAHGKLSAIIRKPDNSALLKLLERYDAIESRLLRNAS